MLRLILAAAAVTTTFILAPTAAADMCDKHGVGPGQIYITACGATSGTGGGGDTSPTYMKLKDANGHTVVNPTNGKPVRVCRSGCDHLDRGDRTLNDLP